jgi:hypothetical protein
MESYQPYITKIWDNISPTGYEISSTAMKLMDDVVFYVFANIASKACTVLAKRRKIIMDASTIQEACMLIYPYLTMDGYISDIAAEAQEGGQYYFPETVIHRYLKYGQLGTKKYRWENGQFEQYETKVSPGAAVALASVLHHITSRILKSSIKQTLHVVEARLITKVLNMEKDLGIFAASNGRSVPQSGGAYNRPPPPPPFFPGFGSGGASASASHSTKATGGGGTIVINSAKDMEIYLSQNASTIQRVLLLNYSRREFLLKFHPDKCISTRDSLMKLFAQLGKKIEFNISGTYACDAIFKKFQHIFF